MYISKLLLLLALIIMFSLNAFALKEPTNPSETFNYEILKSSSDIERLDKILSFIDQLLTNKVTNYNPKEHQEWLKNRPNDSEKLRSIYTKRILSILAKPEQLKLITQTLVENKFFGNKKPLAKQDKIALLILCLEQYTKDTKLPFKGKNKDLVTQDFYNLFTPFSSLYQLGKSDILLMWSMGISGHNTTYSIWTISTKDGNFNAKQLDIPLFNTNTHLVETHPTFNASKTTYNLKSNLLSITTSDGAFGIPGESLHIYQFDKDKLKLAKYSHTVTF